MRNTSIKAPKIIIRLSILLFVVLLSSCGSYAPVSYDNDGIYNSNNRQNPTVAAPNVPVKYSNNQNATSTVFSKQLNDYSLIGNDNEVFTDVENYSSQDYNSNQQDFSYESRPGWNDSYSDTQTNININAGWGFNNFGAFGPFGFNRFGGFNNFGNFGFGFNRFGGFYDPFFHGPFVGNGFYGGFNNGFYGNRFFNNRAFINNRFYANRFYSNSRRAYAPRYANRYNTRSSNNRNYTPRRAVNSRSGRINNSNNRSYTPRRATTTNRSGRTNNSSNNRNYTPRRSSSTNSSARTNNSSNNSRTYTPRTSSNNRSYRSNSSTRSNRSYTPRRSSSSSSRSYRRR